MLITDTHAHIYSELFDNDRNDMMQRALNAGVKRFFVPAIDSSYTQAMFDIENQFPENVFLMMGLHPTHVKENYQEELALVKKWLDSRKFYGVGEIGIDLYWDKSRLQQQQDAFKQQLEWAKEKEFPAIIHIRDSFDEVFEVLDDVRDERLFGIFHCFTGTFEQAKKALSYNMKLGIGGVVTFKNGKIDQFLNEIPIQELVIESDAPYLAPAPHRGKRNESSYLPLIISKLAKLYQLTENEIATITTNNSRDVFRI
ncbi:MAG: TatD family hydrolase [Bacteroidetes bacterium]|jgi:TatD DNase family protein|nr:TatD family hydrolase [Bacteroidota bacterium]